MSSFSSTAASPFELLDLPDGRCYVARPVAAAATLIAGSFARIETAPHETSPVGVYPSRDEAELAIQRAAPSPSSPLAPFAAWLRR